MCRQSYKQLRKQSNFSVGQVADYLSISVEQYSQYESGKKEVPINVLESLADLYHVEEYDILTGTAVSRTVTDSPQKEAELIPFFKIVSAYMKMIRLLEEHQSE